jgi:hypothetical protein
LPGNELRPPTRCILRPGTAGVLLYFLAGGCSSSSNVGPPPVARPADLKTVARSWFGTSLTGPLPLPAAATEPDAAATPVVHCELFLLGAGPQPGPGVTSIAGEIRFVAAPGETMLLRGQSRLTLRGEQLSGPGAAEIVERWRRGDDGNALQVGDERRPLPRATTCWIAAERSENVEDPDNYLGERNDPGPVSKRLGVAVEAPAAGKTPDATAEGALVTLDLADVVRPTAREAYERTTSSDVDATTQANAGLEPRGELVRLASALTPGGGPIIVVVPSPFRDDSAGGRPAPACAVCVELLAVPTAGDEASAHAGAVAETWKAVHAEAEAAAFATAHRPPADAVAIALRRAFQDLKPESATRSTVVYVTTATGASFAGDLALVTSTTELTAWMRELADRHVELAPDVTTAAIGWAVEHSAWNFVIGQMFVGDLAPEIESTILRHAGAVGRLATSLGEAVEESSDLASLEQHFETGNLDALEDPSAASRVRAFDWLSARGHAPAGFDPLGPAEARRRALASAEPSRE